MATQKNRKPENQQNGQPENQPKRRKAPYICALAQQKGGVGKTTTAINLAAALAERGGRVLVADLDPQGALSAGVGLSPFAIKETIYDVLRDANFALSRVVVKTALGFDLVPSNLDLAAAEFELVSEMGREYILKNKLAQVADYDYILIDCPPSLGILTINALAAAAAVIIPVQPQYFALRGLDLLFKTIERVRQRINPALSVLGIVPTLCDPRTRHTREALEELTANYGKLMFQTQIPQTIKLPDSAMAGSSILGFASDSPAATAYRQFAQEVMKRAR